MEPILFERFTLPAYVCIILEKDNKVLLIKRSKTGWMDGFWTIPGGGLEENESLAHATAREAWENGIVLGGISAGSICWFQAGITDSIPGQLTALSCLGFIKQSNCPHIMTVNLQGDLLTIN